MLEGGAAPGAAVIHGPATRMRATPGDTLVAAVLLMLLGGGILSPPLQVLSVAFLDLSMQSAVGRGPGPALGVVAIALVALGTWAATRLASRSGAVLFRA